MTLAIIPSKRQLNIFTHCYTKPMRPDIKYPYNFVSFYLHCEKLMRNCSENRKQVASSEQKFTLKHIVCSTTNRSLLYNSG